MPRSKRVKSQALYQPLVNSLSKPIVITIFVIYTVLIIVLIGCATISKPMIHWDEDTSLEEQNCPQTYLDSIDGNEY